jgi:hypothetical protein
MEVVTVSYNGSGTFQINTSGQPVVAGTVISSTAFNALTADLATGLSTAITKDGQTATTARIPFAAGISSTLVTDSSSVSTGSIITAGGVGIAKALYVGTNANVAGTLGVTGVATFSAAPIYSSLTASSAVATDASKALVSVTNTGTGNNVLATSPTLVTPILGTPASGSLVNCTDTNYTGFKNRIINGAMVIDQRNAGASFTPTDQTYSLDRWKCRVSQASKYTVQQNAGSVTPPAGFKNYLGVTSSSAYSITSSDYFAVLQIVEGLNTYDLNWGTASASTITISFWVRSSLTGTFGGALMNSAEVRSYPFTYTISSANTWEQKSVTIAGDQSGTWLTTNGIGLYMVFGLGVGSTYSGTAGAWAASSTILSATGATSVVGTNGATFYITGVQLEKGSTATSFDYRPYGTELALCQRYYEKTLSQGITSSNGQVNGALIGVAISTTQIAAQWTFKQTKRASPTLTLSSFNGTAGSWANFANTDFSVTQPWGVGDNGFARLDSTSMTAGAGYFGFAVASVEL